MMGLIDTIIGQLAPHDCVGCGQTGSLLCARCAAGLAFAEPRRLSGLRRVAAATTYDTVAKDLVWQLKFQGAQAAASIMATRMAGLVRPDGQQFIVPVPTATRRVRQRGYDQAKLLARQLVKRSGLAYMDCLRREGQAHQVGASRRERLSQLQSAFRLKNGYDDLRDCPVILVDDVLTTGATLEAAAGVLQAAGARYVDAIVFAQA